MKLEADLQKIAKARRWFIFDFWKVKNRLYEETYLQGYSFSSLYNTNMFDILLCNLISSRPLHWLLKFQFFTFSSNICYSDELNGI